MTVVLARREGHHAVGVRRGLQRTETFHVRDVEHVQGRLEADRHPPAVELDRQHRGQEVDLADRVILLRVPEAQPARAARARSFDRVEQGRERIEWGGGGNRCRDKTKKHTHQYFLYVCPVFTLNRPFDIPRNVSTPSVRLVFFPSYV